MIVEIAQIIIDPANAAAFEAAVAEAAPAFEGAEGCHGMSLERIVEDPAQYRLRVLWESVDAHLTFRETPAFQNWRGLAGPFFAATPSVVHGETVGTYF